MKKLKVWFPGFWGSFDAYNNVFTYILSHVFDLEVTPNDPDLVITCDSRFRYQNAKMVYFSGEPFFDIGQCDVALTQFHIDEPRYFRFPLYLHYAYEFFKHGITNSFERVFDQNVVDPKKKENFCAYLAGAPCPTSIRERFFYKLSDYKQVHAAGNHLRNVPGPGGEVGTISGSLEKIKFISNYKFTMAFENKDNFNNYVGWTSEKIIEPMIAGSIPIFWGNARIHEDFSSDLFINWHEYNDDEKVIQRIIEIDSDDDLYMDYVKVYNSKDKDIFNLDYLINLFKIILK